MLEFSFRTYCMGWLPLVYANCTRMDEFNYKTENDREAMPFKADYNTYSGGGYELKLKGHIDKLKERLEILQKSNWIDNRTRALIVEFSVYNAQVCHNDLFCKSNAQKFLFR